MQNKKQVIIKSLDVHSQWGDPLVPPLNPRLGISFLSAVAVYIRSINKNYILKNLLVKVENILTFLSVTFLNLG